MMITVGFSSFANFTASTPSPASPTTVMSGSSSRIRRKPRRTRLWSSTSRTEIFSAMQFHFLFRYRQPHARSPLRGLYEFDLSVEQLGAFTHRDQPDSIPRKILL